MFPMELQNHIRNPQRRRVTTPTSSWANFTPLALNPYVWFDAADTSTITSSNNAVSQWNDKSGNVRNLTQGTAANQPTTSTNTINSLNVVRFDGTSDAMVTGSFATPLWQHVFCVVRPTSFPNAYNTIFEQYSGSGLSILPKSTGKIAIYLDFATNYDGTGTYTMSANTVYLIEYSWNGYQLFSWLNTLSDRTNTVTATMGTPTTGLRLGHSTFASRWWAGDIAETVAFRAPLSQYAQTAMRNYLNAKWAIY